MEIQPVTSPEYQFRERDSDFARLEGLRDVQYKRYLSLEDLQIGSGGTLTSIASGFWGVYLSNGADESVYYQFMRPDLWTNGTIQLKFVWATDGTSTTDVRFVTLISAYKGSTRETILNDTTDVTPTGTASDVQIHTVTSSTSIDADDIMLSFRLQRNGTVDSNPDEAQIWAASWEFLPNHRQ